MMLTDRTTIHTQQKPFYLTGPGLVLVVVLCAFAYFAKAAEALPVETPKQDSTKQDLVKQDLSVIRVKIDEFLVKQTQGYPGKATISVGAIDNNLKLVPCPNVEVFLPPGSRAWGKTSVGARCQAPTMWTIYVQAKVSVNAKYLVASGPLSQGHIVNSQDLMYENGDLAQLPAGVFTDPEQAIGRLVNVSLNAGTVLREEMLKLPPAVQQGQTVQLVSIGNGFRISSEGQAINNASEGQIVQVKVASGQMISGIARRGGQIEVGF
jgi:flagella basal body P-ring formation protein FlgA